jgi:ribosomal protein S18 acetylase RimI-like enzyme
MAVPVTFTTAYCRAVMLKYRPILTYHNTKMNTSRINFKTVITRAQLIDIADILNLQKISFISEAKLYDNFNIEPLTQTFDSISKDFNDYIFLKAVYQNKIIGSVKGRQTPEYCWIGRLIVHPEFQNNGIGKRLMLEIEKEFPNTKQFLLCTGYKSFKNIALYESIGYKRVEELVSDDKIEGIHLVKMIKIIT